MSGVSNTGPLRALLKEAVAAHDLTTDKIADNARGARARSWLAGKQNEMWRKDLLDDAELDALAAGYQLTRRRLREADLEGHGLMERGTQPTPWILEEEVATLTARQREAVKTVIAAMIDPQAQGVVLRGSFGHGTRTRAKDQDVAPRAARKVTGGSRGRAKRAEQDRQGETPPPLPKGDR
jgi:hypothetical protein